MPDTGTALTIARPAEIIFPENPRQMTVALPAEAQQPGGIEAPSGLTPIADFQDPGDYIKGILRMIRPEVGPNKSAMYDLELPGANGQSRIISVWGSTILDTKMALAAPRRGDVVFIQYLGAVTTSRGLNPAKDWRVIKWPGTTVTQTVDAGR